MKPRLRRACAWLVLLLVGALVLKGTLATIGVLLDELRPNPWLTTNGFPRGSGRFSLEAGLLAAWASPPIDPLHIFMSGLSTWWVSAWLLEWPLLLMISTPLWPVCFALLPETRRRAKVHVTHIARAAIYSAAWVVILYIPWIVTAASGSIETAVEVAGFDSPRFLTHLTRITTVSPWERSAYPIVISILCWAWLALWWLMAINRGFQLRHPWGVWVSLLALSTLGTLLICVLLALAGASVFRDHPIIWFG